MPKQPCALCNKQYKARAVRCRQCGRRVCKNCSSFGWCLECDKKMLDSVDEAIGRSVRKLGGHYSIEIHERDLSAGKDEKR